jgi:hypothetical protein
MYPRTDGLSPTCLAGIFEILRKSGNLREGLALALIQCQRVAYGATGVYAIPMIVKEACELERRQLREEVPDR